MTGLNNPERPTEEELEAFIASRHTEACADTQGMLGRLCERLAKRSDLDALLACWDEPILMVLIRYLQTRLGTDRERPRDFEIIQAVAHRINNLRLLRSGWGQASDGVSAPS